MKILFICENYHPHQGGAEVLFKNLAEGLVKAGNEVSIITHLLPNTPKQEILNGVTIQRVFSFNSRYIFSFFAIPRAIMQARKYDIIQTTTFNGALPAWIAAKIYRKPMVLTVHEVWVGKWKEIAGFSRWQCWIHDFLEKIIYLLPFDHYMCVSEATRNDLFKLKISPEKVQTIYNGFDYSFWNPKKWTKKDTYNFREQHNLHNKFVFFSWGRPGPSKGFEYAIKAMPAIIKEVPRAILVLMFGSVEKYPKKNAELLKLMGDINRPENIKVIPSLPYEQLGIALKAADAVIIPSVSEGFGYTTLEAVTMKKPVIISNAGSLPEVVSGKYQIFESKNVVDLAEKAIKV
ncbi:MAG TPA: glycosyltransferase family 4 protein, partial [Candidatus Nanoarchaeia archaeon]|nr:glycosyltransferase family 4 protein [Candidatus Nanoarchaeia archaeon]